MLVSFFSGVELSSRVELLGQSENLLLNFECEPISEYDLTLFPEFRPLQILTWFERSEDQALAFAEG